MEIIRKYDGQVSSYLSWISHALPLNICGLLTDYLALSALNVIF